MHKRRASCFSSHPPAPLFGTHDCSVKAGFIALPTLLKLQNVMAATGTDMQSLSTLPVPDEDNDDELGLACCVLRPYAILPPSSLPHHRRRLSLMMTCTTTLSLPAQSLVSRLVMATLPCSSSAAMSSAKSHSSNLLQEGQGM